MMNFTKHDLIQYITFKTSRSGGKGGQNVNKVNSKVELNFDLEAVQLFSDEDRRRIKEKLPSRFTADGQLQVVSEEERSQLLNKERALTKLFVLLQHALKMEKVRKATKPKKSAAEQRLREKQLNAMKKLNRKKDW